MPRFPEFEQPHRDVFAMAFGGDLAGVACACASAWGAGASIRQTTRPARPDRVHLIIRGFCRERRETAARAPRLPAPNQA